MDTKKDCMIPDCGYLPKMAGQQVIVGAKQLRKALNRGLVQMACLAENADPAITEPIEALCLENRIQCIWVPTMEDLGRACGIEVGAAAAAVID